MSLGKDIDDVLTQNFEIIKQIPEVQEVINKVTAFLHICESKGLIKFPNLQLNQLFQESRHRAEFEVLANSAFVKISGIYNKLRQEGGEMLSENEYVAMNKLFHILSMQANAEELKIYLKAIIDSNLINPNVNELGKYLSMIYDKIGYDLSKRQEMNRILFVELRNALVHLDYDVTLDSFTYRNNARESFTLQNEEFLNIMYQYNAIVITVNEYIENNKTKWLGTSS